MKTSPVSTLAILNTARQSIIETQHALIAAQKEAASGRLADPGLALGVRTGRTVSLRAQHAQLSTLVDTNALVATRLDMTQVTLGDIRESAENFLGALIAAPDGDTGALTLWQQATKSLDGLIAGLNTAVGNQHLFGGVNAGVPPVADYFASPPTAGKQALDNAFVAAFGMTQADPNIDTITGAAMQAFLDGPVAAMFDGPQWSANWSAASSQVIESRISATETTNTSVSANEAGFRKLAMAYTMVADLGADGLNGAAFTAVKDRATELVAEVVSELTGIQARIGGVQARLAQVDDHMSLRVDILAREITDLESVDPFEAATRVTDLMTRLEASYALTARIQGLSLLAYL